jgi:hypothetical protein
LGGSGDGKGDLKERKDVERAGLKEGDKAYMEWGLGEEKAEPAHVAEKRGHEEVETAHVAEKRGHEEVETAQVAEKRNHEEVETAHVAEKRGYEELETGCGRRRTAAATEVASPAHRIHTRSRVARDSSRVLHQKLASDAGDSAARSKGVFKEGAR